MQKEKSNPAQRQALLRALIKRRLRGATRDQTKLYLKSWLAKFLRN
jgi:hypothetical protein